MTGQEIIDEIIWIVEKANEEWASEDFPPDVTLDSVLTQLETLISKWEIGA